MVGLCRASSCSYITTRGGNYAGTPMETATPVLKALHYVRHPGVPVSGRRGAGRYPQRQGGASGRRRPPCGGLAEVF